MAALSFNLQGYIFQQGIGVLIAAYGTASGALEETCARARAEAIAYQQGVASGDRPWIGERDDDGYVIWDQEQVHEMDIESSVEALVALRKAFILALYHHWERSARSWTDDDQRDHAKLVKAAEAMGYPISPRLDAVRDLADLLKHDNAKRGADLQRSWPALLSNLVVRPDRRTNWYDAVRLTEDDLTDAFNIVAASGPDEKMVR